MKVGIKKVHDDEWLVHIGNAVVKLDHFSVEVLNITIENLMALEHGDRYSTLDSYIRLAQRIKELKEVDIQKFVPMMDSRHILNLMMVAEDQELNNKIITNMGAMLAKQFEDDLGSAEVPDEETAKESIKLIIEKMFALEAQGQIEVVSEQTEYI